MGLRERADNRIKLSKRVSSSALVPDKNKLNYFASKPITWSIRFLKLSADSFLPGSPWRVFWNTTRKRNANGSVGARDRLRADARR